jgi:hypothetical protein
MGLDDSDDHGGKKHVEESGDKPAQQQSRAKGFGENDFEHGLCSCFANCDVCT